MTKQVTPIRIQPPRGPYMFFHITRMDQQRTEKPTPGSLVSSSREKGKPESCYPQKPTETTGHNMYNIWKWLSSYINHTQNT